MWGTAERRFVQHDWHVCLRNPFSPFLFGIPSIHSPWEPQHASSALHDGCIMLAKDRVEVSKIWSTGYWLWSRLSYIRVYTLQLQVNEELSRFSFLCCFFFSWPCAVQVLPCQPLRCALSSFAGPWSGSVSLSAADVRNMWRHVCLRNPFSPFLFGIPSIHSPWEPQHAPPALDFCIIPEFVQSQRIHPDSPGNQEW